MQIIQRQGAFQPFLHPGQGEDRHRGQDDNVQTGLDAFEHGVDIGLGALDIDPVEQAPADQDEGGDGQKDGENRAASQEEIGTCEPFAPAPVALAQLDELENDIVQAGLGKPFAHARGQPFQGFNDMIRVQ